MDSEQTRAIKPTRPCKLVVRVVVRVARVWGTSGLAPSRAASRIWDFLPESAMRLEEWCRLTMSGGDGKNNTVETNWT